MKYREVKDGEAGEAWQIRLFGDFKLTRPDGAEVLLNNRKCEGLIAILAMYRDSGVSRDYAAGVLWPGKLAEKQRESLRQALAIIRQKVGVEFIESTRTHCLLSDRLRFECDLDCPDGTRGTVFMRGHEGDWFDQTRVQTGCDTEEPRLQGSVTAPYLSTLRWCATEDPSSMFALLRASPGLVRGLPMGEILKLLATAGSPRGASGWPDYWRGVADDDLDTCATYLRRALKRAIADREWELASDVCYELGKVYGRQGDLQKTDQTVNAAEEIAVRIGTTASHINASRLKGNLLVNWGETEAGLELLRHSADLVEDAVRRAIVESSQAWFEAASGTYERAARTLEYSELLWRDNGHLQVNLLTSMTRAVLSIHDGRRNDVVPGLERVARQSYDSGACQFGVYAEESLAKLHLLDRDRAMAAQKLDSARKNRIRSKMARTPLESAMIAAIR